MKIFAISDLHLSTAVQKPMDIFGNGWENHFEKIAEDWISKVDDGDLVLLGGDISWGLTMAEAAPDFESIAKLPGIKLVGKGNHDYYWTSLSKMRSTFCDFLFLQNNAYRITKTGAAYCFASADKKYKKQANSPAENLTDKENIETADEGKYHVEDGVVIAGSRGWNIPSGDEDKKIYERELQRLELSLRSAEKLRQSGDKFIAMLHYPPFEADYRDTDVTKLLEEFKVDCVLYGHLHGKGVRVTPKLVKNGITYVLTSCDLIQYKLTQVDEI